MSQRKSKGKNKPSLANPINALIPTSLTHLTSFHPSKPLFVAVTTAIGQNVVRIYDTKAFGGSHEVRTEIRLKRGEEVSCVAWSSLEGKKRKRVGSSGDLIIGLKSGGIHVIDQAVGEIVTTLDGHAAEIKGWSRLEDKGWSCALDGKIKSWDIRTGSCLLYHHERSTLIAGPYLLNSTV
jgi:WD40 repeat protein